MCDLFDTVDARPDPDFPARLEQSGDRQNPSTTAQDGLEPHAAGTATVLSALAEAVRQLLDVAQAGVWLAGGDPDPVAGVSACRTDGSGPPPLPAPFAPDARTGDALAARVAATGHALVVSDVRAHPLTSSGGTGAYVGVPLTTRAGATLGALWAADPTVRSWTVAQLAGLRALAAAAVGMLDRRDAQRALVARAEHLALIHDGTPNRIVLLTVVPPPGDAEEASTDTATDPATRPRAGSRTVYRIAQANPAYCAGTGRTREALIGRPIEAVLPGEVAARICTRLDEVMRTGGGMEYDEAVAHPTGDRETDSPATMREPAARTFATRITPIADPAGRVTHVLVVSIDVTTERAGQAALRAREAELRALFAAMHDVVLVLDAVGTYVRVVPTAPTLLVRPAAEMVGQRVHDLLPEETADRMVATVRQVLATDAPAQLDYAVDLAQGRVDLSATASPVGDGTVLWVARDVTAQRRAEAALRDMATRDDLTGLLNRRGLRPLAEQALRAGRRDERHDAVLYLDLDGFKRINDVYGHATGDDALREVAAVLGETLRAGDLAARYGGDEFVVYAAGLAHAGEGAALAARLAAAVAARSDAAAAAGRPWRVAVSVGVAEADAADDLDAMLARADRALYLAKGAKGARAGVPDR